MTSRHQIDISTRFDRSAPLPETREIEAPGRDPREPVLTESVTREIYAASRELESVVNLAIALGRPLLLQGDPGCGKTRLAHALAYSLGLPLEQCYIKSTSRAQDLLYTYDAARRLYDSQLRGPASDERVPQDVSDYIGFGPLGRAIVRATRDRRSVVLIDEIDKADLDFPNDLLRELDRLEFDVPEVPGMRFAVPADRPDLRPIIIVTHNEEKSLPTAFLRRCVYHYVEFPQSELDAILAQHHIADEALRRKAIEVVTRLRKKDLLKKPGLSELLDWAGYLQACGAEVDQLDNLPAFQALIKARSDMKPVSEEFPEAGRA